MTYDSGDQPARPPELFWDFKKVVVATLVFGVFGFFAGWIVFYVMTLGFNVKERIADYYLYGIPIGAVAFAFIATLLFARMERRKLLNFYSKED